ncbi:hypothetical protein GCM10018789_08000 [Streptomyces werraensis]|nr:hypothetical protein GCM10018789_08000 [Streptomyces werraensis]
MPHAGDVQELPADAEITWFVREGSAVLEAPRPLDAVRRTALPSPERASVWSAGESGQVKRLRRHFVRERGVDRRRVTFVGCRPRGLTEQQLRERA